MGVTGLWQVVQPCARPTNLATLNRQRLAVDASIWIYQFMKAMRDKDGNAMHNGHVVGFFRRICKLLFYGVLPVFVFDGGAPALKRMTIQGRKKRREGRRDDAARTAGKLLAVQMQRLADEEEEGRKKKRMANETGTEDLFVPSGGRRDDGEEQQEELPDVNDMVYVDEIGMGQRERIQSRRFQKQDAYHLPDLPGGIETMGQPEDPRIMSVEELEEYARQFNSGEDINLYDFSKIDFDGDFFKSLPPADRYNILNAARLRSRLRMGISKEQLDGMFPNRMAFSKFQIERVKERNRITQRLMFEIGMTGTDLTLGVKGGRIAGDKDREYILVKNDGAEGGWALGVVSRNKDIGQSHQPIDVDEIDVQFQKKEGEEDEDSDEDEDFEDVPVEGLNRLPKPRPGWNATDYMTEQAKMMGASIHELYGLPKGDDDSLFVDDPTNAAGNIFGSQQETPMHEEEDEDLNLAIAMSLGTQHGIGPTELELEQEKGPAPVWEQKAAPTPKPIKGTASGSMIARIVNNRSFKEVKADEERKAAASKKTVADDDEDSSGSEIDFGAALAADAKRRKAQPPASKAFSAVGPSSSSGGLLPFETMNWRKSVFTLANEQISSTKPQDIPVSSKSPLQPNEAETAAFEVDSDQDKEEEEEGDAMAGGFLKPRPPKAKKNKNGSISRDNYTDPDKPLPLPPWLADNSDIREGLEVSRIAEQRQVAEHDAYLDEQSAMCRQKKLDDTIFIQSSDEEGSDVEIIEAPPPPKKSPGHVEDVEGTRQDVEILSFREKSKESMGQMPSGPDGDIVMVEKEPEEAPAEVTTAPKPATADEDEDLEFEDVAMPEPEQQARQAGTTTNRKGSPDPFADIQPDVQAPKPSATNDEDDIFAGIEAPPELAAAAAETGGVGGTEGEPYSDPDEDELMLEMAAEAEAHAAFASTLKTNHTSLLSNTNAMNAHSGGAPLSRAALEKEIAALTAEKNKHQRDSDEVTQVMISEVQSLLRLFGIPYITAPMEAEAQCAELVRLNLVDGIVTDDSDTFLFGGTRVYKNMFNGNKFVECYLAADLEGDLSLGRGELICLAQLLGSDYVAGLAGVGPVTAVELLAEFSGGGSHANKDALGRLEEFREWWTQVQQTGKLGPEDAQNKFRKKFRKSHGKKLFLAPGFPSKAVEEAYTNPHVDSSRENFVWGSPDMDGLRRFLMGTVGWGPQQTDEVLVPVIRDMIRRQQEGTQSNITRFFSIAPGEGRGQGGRNAGEGRREAADTGAGGEVFAPRQRGQGMTSKRMSEAVGRLRARQGGGGIVEDAEEEEDEEGGEGVEESAPPKKKRKARRSVPVVGDEGGDGAEEDDDDDDDDDYDAIMSKKGSGKAKKRAKAS
ncbi:hypothetical protein MKZ38_004582 [Zalerion maritima]|uniref:PIN domain-like protein n=1 Tax=Zalerion maritima TaxID=339359 RepID=A0AAD5RYJ0_9PEZI|nr:hypothetical protein MKZ38_004582 [Zalerion maritima]